MFDIGKKDDSTSPGGTTPPKPGEPPKPGGVTPLKPGVSPAAGGPPKPPLGGPPSTPTPPPVSTPPVGGPKPLGGEPTLKEVMAELKDIKSILAKMEAKSGG